MRLDLHRLVQEAACVDAVATYVDVAGFLFNVVKEDIICQKISVIDLVYNHTITLECELKVVSRMPSTKRPAAMFARAADITSKQIPLETTWFPM